MKQTFCDDPRHKKNIPLDKQPIKGYPHDGGWKVPGVAGDPDESGLYWLYITCPGCGYEWAIWKLGVSRSYDPTAELETWKCNRCGRLHEGPPTFCGGCGNDQFTKETPKPINWNEPHATAKLLKRYSINATVQKASARQEHESKA